MTDLVIYDAKTERNQARARAAIESAGLAKSSKAEYLRALQAYFETGGDPFDFIALGEYAQQCTASQRSKLSAAIGHYTETMIQQAQASATPDNVAGIQATIWRMTALRQAVKTERAAGQKTHIWLSEAEVKALLATCDKSLSGQRDRVALGLLVGAGLRRDEAINLSFEDVLFQPVSGRMRAVLAVRHGKGDKQRTVPISDFLAAIIDDWSKTTGGQGRILRGIDQRGELRDSLSGVGLFAIVRRHGAAIGRPELAPHDLRRTYAQIGVQNGVPLTQIKTLLGHSSIATTQAYLCLELNLSITASDFVPLG